MKDKDKKLKLLVTTRADAAFTPWVELTHPIIRQYAQRINADFLVLDEGQDCREATGGIGNGIYQYRIMKHYDLHATYDRILHLDSDMILTPDCPNLFDVVPDDHVGTILEDKGTRKLQRLQCVANAQKQFGDIGWKQDYINTGVFVTSKCHKDVYLPIQGKYFVDWGTDDIHIGYHIKRLGYPIHELSYHYNHMTMFSEAWNGNPDRFDSYIIHYAGAGIFDGSRASSKLEQATQDYQRLYG
tara:strand:- start:3397 stop:4125 length:729 start_codon:yes stop_codon:yes gene_type:complete